MAGQRGEEEEGLKSAKGNMFLTAPTDHSSWHGGLTYIPSLPSLPWEPEQEEQQEMEFRAVLELLCHEDKRCADCRQLAMVT